MSYACYSAKNNDLGIFSECHLLEDGIMSYNESLFKSPLKGFIKKLKDIKDSKPNEYDGPKEVKNFVDKNYDDIIKASELLEKEPDELNKSAVRYLITVGISLVTTLIGSASGLLGILILGGIIEFVSSIIYVVSSCIRETHDSQTLNELLKIQQALKKVNTSKLSDDHKKKINKMITAIDDASTAVMIKSRNI